eukprot:COSAG02_NODE_40576_length_404_cov_0.613115_1_plen_57_part_01
MRSPVSRRYMREREHARESYRKRVMRAPRRKHALFFFFFFFFFSAGGTSDSALPASD